MTGSRSDTSASETAARKLDGIVAFLKDKKNVEVSAVCDVWTHNLERAVAANQKYYGKAPRRLSASAGVAGAQRR